jgi:hypothetical protein
MFFEKRVLAVTAVTKRITECIMGVGIRISQTLFWLLKSEFDFEEIVYLGKGSLTQINY